MQIWLILAQIMGVVTIIFDFITYQVKNNRRKYLLIYAIGSVFWTLMFVFMGLYTGFNTQTGPLIAAAFGIIRSLVFFWIFTKETKGRKIAGKVFLYCFLAVALFAGVKAITGAMQASTTAGVLQIVAMVFALLFVVGQYLPSDHYVRIFQVMYSVAMFLIATPLNILEGDFRWNVMGMAIEVGKIVAIIFFYFLIYYRKWLKKKLVQIKFAVANQMTRITSDSDVTELDKVMTPSELEKLVAKMVRYELSAINKSAIKDVESAEKRMLRVLEDIKTVQDVKDILAKSIDQKTQEIATQQQTQLSHLPYVEQKKK